MKLYKSKLVFPIGAIAAITIFIIVTYLGLWSKIWGLNWCCGVGFILALIFLFMSNYSRKTVVSASPRDTTTFQDSFDLDPDLYVRPGHDDGTAPAIIYKREDH